MIAAAPDWELAAGVDPYANDPDILTSIEDCPDATVRVTSRLSMLENLYAAKLPSAEAGSNISAAAPATYSVNPDTGVPMRYIDTAAFDWRPTKTYAKTVSIASAATAAATVTPTASLRSLPSASAIEL